MQLLYKQGSTRQDKNFRNSRIGQRNAKKFVGFDHIVNENRVALAAIEK